MEGLHDKMEGIGAEHLTSPAISINDLSTSSIGSGLRLSNVSSYSNSMISLSGGLESEDFNYNSHNNSANNILLNAVSGVHGSPAVAGSKPPKLRRKRKFNDHYDTNMYELSPSGAMQSGNKSPMGDSSNASHEANEPSGSLLKRRKKMELQLNLQETSANANNNRRGRPQKTTMVNGKANIITDMGPPNDTPSKLGGLSTRKRTRNYYETIAPNSLGVALESPFGNGLSSTGFPISDSHFPLSCTADTPAKLMQFDPPLSKSDGNGFDFDEIVSHFPSPRPGDTLGASPHRWSGDSTGSMGSNIFTFPESVVNNANRLSSSGEKLIPGGGITYSTRSTTSHNSKSSSDTNLLTTSSSSSMDHALHGFEAPLSTSSTISFVNNLSSTVSWGGYTGNFNDTPANYNQSSVTAAGAGNGFGFGPKRKGKGNGNGNSSNAVDPVDGSPSPRNNPTAGNTAATSHSTSIDTTTTATSVK